MSRSVTRFSLDSNYLGLDRSSAKSNNTGLAQSLGNNNAGISKSIEVKVEDNPNQRRRKFVN